MTIFFDDYKTRRCCGWLFCCFQNVRGGTLFHFLKSVYTTTVVDQQEAGLDGRKLLPVLLLLFSKKKEKKKQKQSKVKKNKNNQAEE